MGPTALFAGHVHVELPLVCQAQWLPSDPPLRLRKNNDNNLNLTAWRQRYISNVNFTT